MINFEELELKVNTKYSFVGIQKEGSKLIFHIPKGFSESDSSLNTFDSKRDLFFRLYRVLNLFKQTCIEKGYFKTGVVTKADDRDGVAEDDTGSEITSNDDSKNIFYSKIDALGSILDAYDELKILSLVSRLGKSERLDYSKLHRYLNKAVFLNNGSIYIDAMNLPRKEIHFDATDIVAMYCYILIELKEQLKLEVNSSEINSLAERFKEKYLGSEYSLFSEKYYLRVINDLQDALESIDHYTPIKDSDYWDFYEAIYKFLFGEFDNSIQGKVWGFSNFNTIWESMCLTHVIQTLKLNSILYLDKKFISNTFISKWNNCNKIIDISHIFNINDTDIFPDLVIWSFESEEDEILSLNYREFNKKNHIKYSISKDDSWNDYGYLTQFDISIDFGGKRVGKSKIIKITDINQRLKENCFDHCLNYLSINSNKKLKDNFFSYWDIINISHEELTMMQSLNHIFHRALLMKIYDHTNFFNQFICNVLGDEASIYDNIFYQSLFRQDSRRRATHEINNLYKEFIDKLNFYIIDIKYSTPDYYTNSENIQEIKSISLRKQFVYEYLLQKHLEKTNNPLKELDIKSEFWLPAYSSNEETFTPLPKYMDDYVKLTGVNIMAVIDSYLETEET